MEDVEHARGSYIHHPSFFFPKSRPGPSLFGGNDDTGRASRRWRAINSIFEFALGAALNSTVGTYCVLASQRLIIDFALAIIRNKMSSELVAYIAACADSRK